MTSYEALEKIIKEQNFKRCLEFGTGKSTEIIRNSVSRATTVVSLEVSPYYEQSLSNMPNTANHKIQKVEICYKNGIILKNFKPSGIYDLVYVDFPNGLVLKSYPKLFKKLAKKCGMEGKEKKYGFQSSWILGYIWNYINNESFVLVDHRVGSVYAFKKMFPITVINYGKQVEKKIFHPISTTSLIKKLT